MTNHDRERMSPARRRTANALRDPLLCLAAAALTSAAGAATVKVTFDTPIFNGSGYDNIAITFPKPSPLAGSTTLSVAAGRFQGRATNLVDVDPGVFVDSVDDLYMYCYDVYETIGSGRTVVYTVNFGGESTRTLDFLGAVNAVMNQGQAVADAHAWLHPVNGYQAAAIQIGIWESHYETDADWSVTAGSFRASGLDSGSAASPKTAQWLSRFFDSIGSSGPVDGAFVMTLEASGAQDMLTGDPPSNVPVPGTLALVGLALAGLPAARRRRRSG